MIDDEALRRWLPRAWVALLGDLLRATLWMLLIVALLSYVRVYARLGGLLLEKPDSNDFTIFYYTARMVSEGRSMYGNLPRTYGLAWKGAYLGNLNPPHFQLFMMPLVPLGYRGALSVWLLANVLVVAAWAWLITRELRPRLTLKRVLLTALLVFASAAWTSVAVTGEMSLVLLLPFTFAWVAARRGRWGMSGLWLGVCLSFKVFFLVFFAWLLVTRNWRAVASMVVGALVPAAIGAAAFGTASYVAWVRGLFRVGWWYLPMNISIRGLTERVFNAGVPYAPVWHVPGLSRPAWLLLAGIVALATAARTWPRTSWCSDVDRTYALLLVAALLVSPLGWIYYLPLVTGPLIALSMRRQIVCARWYGVLSLSLALALLYVPMEVTEMGQPKALATLTLASAHGWGALLLWIALLSRASVVPPPAARC